MHRPDTADPDTGHCIFTLMPGSRQARATGAAGDELVLHTGEPGLRGLAAGDGKAANPAVVIDDESALEKDFPGVLALLQRVWGLNATGAAFRTLFVDKEGKPRPWPRAVWNELLLLWEVHLACGQQQGEAAVAADPTDPRRFSILELGYGHVVERIVGSWSDPSAFGAVFQDLIIDNRGSRQGWPPDIWRELLFLQELRQRVQEADAADERRKAREALAEDAADRS